MYLKYTALRFLARLAKYKAAAPYGEKYTIEGTNILSLDESKFAQVGLDF